MAYYAIGIGGTGAKCLESLIHLAAAGMMPDDKDLYILFVDPDEANGCLKRAVETLNHYKTFNTNPRLAQKSLLRTKIPSVVSHIWTPFGDHGRTSLSDFFGYPTLRKDNPATSQLFEVLYSKKEREEKLDKGFRGHPSIGASVMAKTVELGQGEPWNTFRILVAKDTDAKVFLAGSIFGGTGASGFPTVAELVKNEFPNVSIGGALVLPYFTFTDKEANKKGEANNAEANNELKAEAEHFLINTQAALKYYHLWNKKLIYDAIYLFGDESQIEFDASLGGPKQQNASHFIELYAALAAIHFFDKDPVQDGNAQYFMTARGKNNSLQWKDLPDGIKGDKIRSKINQLTHFAFAYLSIYQPMLEDIRLNGSGYRAPWYIDFFEQNNISFDEINSSLDNVRDYCQDFLLWLANIEYSSNNSKLVKYEEYAYPDKQGGKIPELKLLNSFSLKAFGNLVSPYKSESLRMVNKLWEDMCLAKGKGDGPGDIGKFIATLYQKCATV